MDLCVVHVRRPLYVLFPVGLKFCNIMSETSHDRSFEALYLVAALGVICSRGQVCEAQMYSNCRKELQH